jgi:hypothetical protein
MEAYLRLFEKATQQDLTSHKIDAEARRCVILAIKVPTEVDFGETLKLNAVKYLQGVPIFTLLITDRKAKMYLTS